MQRKFFSTLISLIILCFLVLLSLAVGSSSLEWSQLLLFQSADWHILLSSRLPRTLSILIAGSSLSLAGLLAQNLTQNRFASPTTMGTMASGRLALILALLFFPKLTILQRSMFAFVFSLAGTFLFIRLIDRIQLKENKMIAIIGLIFSNLIQSLGTYLAIQFNISQQVTAFFQASFSSIHSENFQLIFISLIALIGTIIFAHYFAVLGLGRDLATELGIHFERIRFLAITFIALSSASVLLTVGNIPFIAIVIPNLITYIQGDQFSKNIGAVLIIGPIFLLLADIMARLLIHPFEIPVSILVGVIGSILFLVLLVKGESA